MVAAMPLTQVGLENKKTVTSNDLRNIAFGLAAALALILVAGQIAESDSASATPVLEESQDASWASVIFL